MIKSLRIIGEHAEADDSLQQYISQKIGNLDKYLPRRARRTARAEVVLRREKSKKVSGNTVEVLLYVPDKRLSAKAAAATMFMALDLVEEKLKQQLGKYKDEHSTRFYRHLIHRLRGSKAL